MERRKIAVITGSTGGLGAAIAEELAAQRWDLVLVNRPGERAEQQVSSLKSRSPGANIRLIGADLLETSAVLDVADTIRESFESIDALLNIAGVLTEERVMNSAGYESNFAINTHAPYMLASGLREQLARAGAPGDPSVVVALSSSAINSVKRLEIDTLLNPESIGGLMGAYARTKLALTAATAGLSAEFLRQDTLMVSIDPGPMKTGMTAGNAAMPVFLRPLVPLLFRDPGAVASAMTKTLGRLNSDHAGRLLDRNGKTLKVPATARDPAIQQALLRLLQSCMDDVRGSEGDA